ncbi:type III-B CRISPR module RAMP protein Cmr6 [Oleidesulfovibrio alaskensis]|jgi:CRISPR-associated protein Cmr6
MGNRPIYAKARNVVLPSNGDSANLGLYFYKYYNCWYSTKLSDGTIKHAWAKTKLPKGTKETEPRLEWLQSIAEHSNRQAKPEEALARQAALVKAQGGRLLDIAFDSMMVTGLGNAHPLENGFTWHHSLSVPYLPASGVKGAVRSYAEEWERAEEEELFAFFGQSPNAQAEQDGNAGRIIFFDMLPQSAKVVIEVLTPHYGKYYLDAQEPPADWSSPNPTHFLALQSPKFQCGIAHRLSHELPKEKVQADLDKVCRWIERTAEVSGFGAKTTSGFGRADVKVS